MDADQARDHIEMVQQILAQSRQRLCAGGEYFVVWGLYSGFATAMQQIAHNGLISLATALWATLPVLLACVAFTIIRSRQSRHDASRRSLLQREFLNVLALSIGLAVVANLGAYNIFRGWGSAGVWSFAEAMVLFYIGMHGNRRAQIAGIAVVASLIAANFTAQDAAGYVLGIGMVVGYAGFGTAELLARD